MYKAAIITCSDKGHAGEREDAAGSAIRRILEAQGYCITEQLLLPDDEQGIAAAMKRLCDDVGVQLICTTGGTGFSPRDRTPEATLSVVERLCPGIPEAMRAYSLSITPRALLSRAVAGIRGQTLIINLPGSPKAVTECLGSVIDALGHGLDILLGRDAECART